MSLYDVIDDISEKNLMKTEMGENRVFGVMVGVVAKNYDKDHPGFLYVSIPTRDQADNVFQWARLAMISSGKSWGSYFMPEIEDQVLLAFEDGIFERPFVIGCVPKDKDSFLSSSFHEKNQIKRIVTRNGSTIQFDDCDGEDGEKDKILIETAKGEHKILFDNENKKIKMSDKDGKNSIEMQTEDGNMIIKAEKKLTIKIGSGVTVTMSDDTGAVKIECKEFKVKASTQTKMESDGTMSLSGAQVKLVANTSFKVESSGMVTIAGSPISLG